MGNLFGKIKRQYRDHPIISIIITVIIAAIITIVGVAVLIFVIWFISRVAKLPGKIRVRKAREKAKAEEEAKKKKIFDLAEEERKKEEGIIKQIEKDKKKLEKAEADAKRKKAREEADAKKKAIGISLKQQVSKKPFVFTGKQKAKEERIAEAELAQLREDAKLFPVPGEIEEGEVEIIPDWSFKRTGPEHLGWGIGPRRVEREKKLAKQEAEKKLAKQEVEKKLTTPRDIQQGFGQDIPTQEIMIMDPAKTPGEGEELFQRQQEGIDVGDPLSIIQKDDRLLKLLAQKEEISQRQQKTSKLIEEEAKKLALAKKALEDLRSGEDPSVF